MTHSSQRGKHVCNKALCIQFVYTSMLWFNSFFVFFPQQARIWHRLPISWLPTGCYPEPHLLHSDCTLQLPLLQVPLKVSNTLNAPVVFGMPRNSQKREGLLWAVPAPVAVRCIVRGITVGTKGLNAHCEVQWCS